MGMLVLCVQLLISNSALGGFLLSLSPLSCDLMGWRGAGGNGAASTGAFFFFGGLLMILGATGEVSPSMTFRFPTLSIFD